MSLRAEEELREVLALVTLPAGFADATDEAVQALEPKAPTAASSPELRSRLGRRRELYEFGDLTRDEYLARRERLQQRLEAPPRARTQTELERNGEQIRTLVDEWDEMTLEERRTLIAVVFPAVYAAADGLHRLRPHQDWFRYRGGDRASGDRRDAPEGAGPT